MLSHTSIHLNKKKHLTYSMYMITPSAQQSTGRPYLCLPTTSGAGWRNARKSMRTLVTIVCHCNLSILTYYGCIVSRRSHWLSLCTLLRKSKNQQQHHLLHVSRELSKRVCLFWKASYPDTLGFHKAPWWVHFPVLPDGNHWWLFSNVSVGCSTPDSQATGNRVDKMTC